MKNQDMPANPTRGQIKKELSEVLDYQVGNNGEFQFTGETKREKAFWKVYSAMIGGLTANPNSGKQSFDDIASAALSSVEAGFKALEKGE